MPRPTAKVFPALSRTTHAHNNFTNPPLVNIFLTTPNAPFIKATKNFLFSLEVALPFTFLLLKRLSLNRSVPFCVSKKNLSTLWKFLNLFSHWLTSFSSRISYFPLYNLVRFQFCFILTISPEECQMKSFGKKNILLHAISPFHGCIVLTRVFTGFRKKRGFISAQIWQFEHTFLKSSTENGKFSVFTKCDNRVTPGWPSTLCISARLSPLYITLLTLDKVSGTIFCLPGLWTIL